jgi:hypothetical protein
MIQGREGDNDKGRRLMNVVIQERDTMGVDSMLLNTWREGN